MDIIQDRGNPPCMEAIAEYIGEPGRGRWRSLTGHIEDAYAPNG